MAVTSISCFGLDVLILFLLVELLLTNYLISAVISFIIAHTINYILSRYWIFKGTKTKFAQSYLQFFLVAIVGIIFLVSAMTILVETLNLHYLVSKILVAITLGLFNFFMNYFFTFKLGHEFKRKHPKTF